MKKFLKNTVLFFLVILVIGEIVVRITHSVSDIPQRTIDKFHIQKYYPNQEGYWKGGDHKWMINKLGWPGELPESFDDLILVIGDSFIENFMNPSECHQSKYLKENMEDYNFMEAGRSGVSLIEAMEINKQLDSLTPLKSLIYVNDNDFFESIVDIKTMKDITQLDLKDENVVYGEMKSPGLKKVLYNWKLLYYFYNRFPIDFSKSKEDSQKIEDLKELLKNNKEKVFDLLKYITTHYKTDNQILVFHPNSSEIIIEACKEVGFEVIILDSSKSSNDWTFDYDSHWTCYGHKQVANQVSRALINALEKNN
ncbi:hypothetical protein [Winogradskyella sp. SYSU M77433]|uniref:hypothetical protein n=1 Tax=Winogradskyella sp. SYSU M77433 TaxID=3042722 RepID=UPI00248023BA|nr:hypothetical protein [Winogradskyella sp. SYSU M77433]MDH7913956.1 hypothetical protein [Winogradskyella sp. SYSU M77433]